MMIESLFFPKLTRRIAYRMTRSGTFYKNYAKYRLEIREDCLGRCVYCDCHENELGGHEEMNLDHFRPKGLDNYAHLENDPYNLVWSCRRCNGLKSHHWPAFGMDATIVDTRGFIDPFEEDRQEFFSVGEDGVLHALKPPAGYMIELLGLNTYTPRSRRKKRLDVADQIAQSDEMLEMLSRQETQTEYVKDMIKILCMNRAIFESMLDFELH